MAGSAALGTEFGHARSMDIRLRAFAESHAGVFTRSAALAAGYSDVTIRTNIVRKQVWRRLRRGVYVEADYWDALDDIGRHVVAARAVSLRCADDAVFSHVTGAVIRGWQPWGIPLNDVCVTRGAHQAGRREADVHHYQATLEPGEIELVGGLRVCSKERLMVDICREYEFERAVVLCDAALRAGADREEALRIYLSCNNWPKTAGLRSPIQFADGRAANPAESRLRVRLSAQGLPDATPQARIYGRDGRFLGRVDLYYEGWRTVVEFDGRYKYGFDGRDPREQLFAEKCREDTIREEAGLEFVRVTWEQLDKPRVLAARIRAAGARAAARHRLGA